MRHSPRLFRLGTILFTTLLLLAPRVASAQCAPVTPVVCPNCFAVVIMPDTQHYTEALTQPAGSNHLDLVTRYVCQHRTAWTEPTTGKTMPILMVLQLGDLVERADEVQEYERVSAAFANLDQCDPVVPYVVTSGNHDVKSFNYERHSNDFSTYFGPDRWVEQGVACTAPDDCDWSSGKYFIGGGDTIKAFSRNNENSDGGFPGPPSDQVGRHRAGIIRAPNGQPFLFLGLEMAFDFPPAAPGFEGVEGNDSSWPQQILGLYPGVPTIVFHHSMLWAFDPPDTRIRWGPETWHSDSISLTPGMFGDPDFGTEGGMKDLFDLLIEPYPQVRFLFTGHVYNPTHQADYTIPRSAGPPVWAFLRNYQRVDLGLPGNEDRYGVGWNAVAVFDPDSEEVRVRSYRIDDVEAYTVPPVNYDHVGQPAATECLETDQGGIGERVISWDFETTGAATPCLSTAGLAGLVALVMVTARRVMRPRTRIP